MNDQGSRTIKTEKDKMLAGELYDPMDPELETGRCKAREMCRLLNATSQDQKGERRALLDDLFEAATEVLMQPPFYCEYGTHIALGRKVLFNFNCVLLDVAPVKIGNGAYIGSGTVITKDVPDDAMAVERSPQNNRDGGAKRYREMKMRAKAENKAEKKG